MLKRNLNTPRLLPLLQAKLLSHLGQYLRLNNYTPLCGHYTNHERKYQVAIRKPQQFKVSEILWALEEARIEMAKALAWPSGGNKHAYSV